MRTPSFLNDNFLTGIVCLTVLTLLYLLATAEFDVCGLIVTLATGLRIMFPRSRSSRWYRYLMHFDMFAFLQTIRKKMNHVGKARQAALFGGTIMYFGVFFMLVILFTRGMTLNNLENPYSVFVPPLLQEISVTSLIIVGLFLYIFYLSTRLIGFGYYNRFNDNEQITNFAKSLHPTYRKGKVYKQIKHPWNFMNKPTKIKYALTLGVGLCLIMVEVYELGFIMSPAQTFGTPLQSRFQNLVLSTFGSWTGALVAEIAVLASIGVTAIAVTRIIDKIDRNLPLDNQVTRDFHN